MIEVFSSGGGTQSTAIALLIVQGRLPKPDLVVIADTGRECQTTWDYLDTVTRPALLTAGVDVHRIAGSGSRMGIMDASGKHIHIPAFTTAHGDVGKLPGYCSGRWKSRTIDRFLSRQHGITRSKYIKWVGFSFDEGRRAQRIIASQDGVKGLIRLPLIELRMTRTDALREVEKAGWPTPPRSRCWMCPNQRDEEWRNLPAEEFGKAIGFEREMKNADGFAWLHRSCVGLGEVDFNAQMSFDTEYCCGGACFI